MTPMCHPLTSACSLRYLHPHIHTYSIYTKINVFKRTTVSFILAVKGCIDVNLAKHKQDPHKEKGKTLMKGMKELNNCKLFYVDG